MIKLILLIVLYLPSFAILSQEIITIKGVVSNSEKEVIPEVLVFLSTHNNHIIKTNEKGVYIFPISKNATGEIIFNQIGYAQTTVPLTKKLLKSATNDTLILNITLKGIELKEVVIGGKQKPQIMYGSPEHSISDFTFDADNILLLCYDKSIKKDAVLKLVNKNQELICEYNCPEKAIELFCDYQDFNYLITESKIYLITIFQKEIRLREVDKKQFYDFTSKIIDTVNQQYLYTNFSDVYPAFDFYHQPMFDKISQKFHHIEDQFMMDLYRAEFKYASTRDKLWALRQEVETGVDKEIWIGAKSFTNSLYYKTLYAPLVVFNDTLRIFDHYKDLMYVYDTTYSLLDSLPISYHTLNENKNWEQPLIKDELNTKVYALFLSEGYHYLKDISLNTGKTSTAFKLFYKYSENIKIKSGYVYYIYRPYESLQRKYLYREKLYMD